MRSSSNIVIGFPNLIDGATLSGGAWRSGDVGLAALQDRRLGRPARTVDTDPASTRFKVSLGVSSRVGIYGLIGHNLSVSARWRVTLAADEALTHVSFASGWVNVWPVLYTPAMLEFEDENWWSGTLTEAQRASYPASTIILPDAFAYGAYCLVEIEDPTNTAGYIDVPRLFLGPTWSPEKNATRGMTLGLQIDTVTERARGGTMYSDVRAPRRLTGLSLDALTHEEAIGSWLDMVRQAGVDKEVLFVPNPHDAVNLIRRSYLGRFAQIDPVAFPDLAWRTTATQIEEIT